MATLLLPPKYFVVISSLTTQSRVRHLYSFEMSTSLLATKFFAPPRPTVDVYRPNLVKRIESGVSGKVTLVCAAAGFGKSTLISQWAHDCPYPSAWLSLDEDDRDISRFLEYLATSMEVISQSVGAGVASLLRGSPPCSAETVLTLLINQLSTVNGKLVLVLDDYHLAASKSVDHAVTFLIDHMPTQLHLVIASREEPEIPLGKLRINGQLSEVRQQDLRFDLEQATDFFNQCMDIRLSKTQVHALEARTEGWISGLKLAAISLRMYKDPETFISSFAGSHHFVQDYLIEEVLNQQPADIQAFLLRTSVLDRLCGPLCDAVLQSHGGQQVLNQLNNANLFIVPLDNERRWYRYHHLFSELLRQRLVQMEPAEPLHLRASQWYETKGLEVEAFNQATLANDIPTAIRLIDGNGMPLYFRGETAPVMQWLSTLPHSVLNTYPSLWIAFSWSLLFAGQPALLEAKLQSAEAAVRIAPQDMLTVDIPGQIAVLWGWLAVYRNDPDSIFMHASRALERLSPQSLPACTAAQCALGVAQMFRGQRAEASLAFSKVIDAGKSSGNLMFTAVAATAQAGIQATDYRLHVAAASYRGVIKMIDDPNNLLGFEAHLGLAKILFDWNELDEAETHALLCSELVTRARIDTELGADLLRARLMMVQNEHVKAEALLCRTDAVSSTGHLTDRLREALDLRVMNFLRCGEMKKAAELSGRHQLSLGLARTELAQNRGSEAVRVIERHRQRMQEQDRTHDVLKAMVLQAVALYETGRNHDALRLLREVLTQAELQGSIRLFVDEGDSMKALLAQLHNEDGNSRYVSQILVAFGQRHHQEKQVTTFTSNTSSQLPLHNFSQRELKILRLIQEGHSNQTISEQLFLSLSTIKWHNQNIFAKLDVQRRTEAVARALQLKLL